MNVIRVVLLEDHAMVREGVRLVLEREPDIEIVGEAGSLADLGPLAAREDVADVVVCDLSIEDAPGAAVVPAVRQRFPDAAVLVLSMLKDPEVVHAVLAAGATGYVLKEAASTDLVDAVRRVAEGGAYLESALGFELIRRAGGERREVVLAFNERETMVLRLLALGHTNAAIASRLGVSLRTVENDRSRIQRALGARSRAELVEAAIQAGLLVRS